MLLNSVTVGRHSQFCCPYETLSHRPPTSRAPHNCRNGALSSIPSHNLRSSPSCRNSPLNLISYNRDLLVGFPLRLSQMGIDYTRISAVTYSGSGGFDNSGGSDGDGGRGRGNGGSGDDGVGGEAGNNSNGSLLSWYLDLLVKFPVMTKAVTSALLTFVGDLICQFAIDKVQSPDYKRTFIFTLLGLVLVGPTLHFWYLYLSKLVTTPGASGAILRLLLDQFMFSPLFIGFFLSTLVTLEGRPSEVMPKLQQEWLPSVLANWQLWVPFQFFNFRFVPQQFQVLAANVVALAWNVILSYKAHKEVLPKQGS